MITSISEQSHLLSQLKAMYEAMPATDVLKRSRTQAWERFTALGLPTRQLEVYRYVRLLRHLYEGTYLGPKPTTLTAQQVLPHVARECRSSYLVFVNGVFEPHLSDTSELHPKISIADLEQASHSYGAFLHNSWTQGLKEETDPLAALNAALHPKGIFIYVPPQCVSDVPLQVLHFVDGEQLLALPRVQIIVGKESNLTYVSETIHLSGAGTVSNQVCDLTLEENAQVHLVQISRRLPTDGWHFDAIRARLKRHSQLKVVSFTDGAMTVRTDYRVLLTGEGADACLNGVWMLDEKREAHANVLIEHQAPHCRSNQLYKGVLADFSRSSFEGKILVQRPAQKTEAYQLNNNLLLSDKANADSKPNLEVFADDVKASHGATVGQLDDEQLFYLQTRGIWAAEAKNLLVAGFAKEVVDLISVPSIRERLTSQVQTFLA